MSGDKTSHDPSEKEIALRSEQEALKQELQQIKDEIEGTEKNLSKSIKMRETLDKLAKELENRTKDIKADNQAKIKAAESQSQELAHEVSTNMGIMQNIHSNLSEVTTESSKAREENENLAKKVAELKATYDAREKVLQEELDLAHNSLIKAQTDLAQLKLKNAEEKEKMFGEMQKVASGLVESRQQMKEAKETELGLRTLLQKYDDKFKGLQQALNETNVAYDTFKVEMDQMVARTKELEQEATKWQKRWEESNEALLEMTKNHEGLQKELHSLHDKLVKMTSLCRALQKEIAELEQKRDNKAPANKS